MWKTGQRSIRSGKHRRAAARYLSCWCDRDRRCCHGAHRRGPGFGRGHRSVSLHVAIETAASLIALLAAYLVFGRFQQNARLSDLTLVCALAVFGLTNVLFRTVPAVLTGEAQVDGFALWALCAAA